MGLTIGKKLSAGFLLILLLLAIGSVISINRISFTEQAYKQLIDENIENSMHAKDLQMLYLNQSTTIKNYLMTGDDTYITQYEEYLAQANGKLKQMLEAYKDEGDLEIIKQLVAFQTRYDEIVQKEIRLKKAGDETGYINLMNTSGKTISNVFQKKIAELDSGQEKIVFSGIQNASYSVSETKIFVLIIGLISVCVGIVLSVRMSRSIAKPIKQAAEVIHQVAEGDLQIQELKKKTNDEVGILFDSSNRMVQDLREIVGQIQESSASMASSSEELAASALESTSAAEQVSRMTQDSAEGNEQQLLQYRALSHLINEMNNGIHQVAVNSEDMLHLTKRTSDLTVEGEKYIDHVVGQMNQIQQIVSKASGSIHSLRERSDEISQIIGIITGVAEQTNLLALNATIEAARAGEHGRGFAVVADEVRKLAEESKKSAGQITKMIHHIQVETMESVQMMEQENTQVEQGLKETEEAYHAFKSISQAMGKVTGKVDEVSSSVSTMLEASNRIMQSIERAKEITERSTHNSQESAAATQQQFAAMEEVAASAQFLSKMAEDLLSIISKFKL